jgi:hypothetical protein
MPDPAYQSSACLLDWHPNMEHRQIQTRQAGTFAYQDW